MKREFEINTKIRANGTNQRKSLWLKEFKGKEAVAKGI
ncbi:hypothetical protein BLFGPEAP_00429 [Candidatus Methanoperedenaceae archaeon GB50]|nr:hypothetical protein BLFGPEAP_00429 [Candidatus Methanoperedenaceae archaeon GB50]